MVYYLCLNLSSIGEGTETKTQRPNNDGCYSGGGGGLESYDPLKVETTNSLVYSL